MQRRCITERKDGLLLDSTQSKASYNAIVWQGYKCVILSSIYYVHTIPCIFLYVYNYMYLYVYIHTCTHGYCIHIQMHIIVYVTYVDELHMVKSVTSQVMEVEHPRLQRSHWTRWRMITRLMPQLDSGWGLVDRPELTSLRLYLLIFWIYPWFSWIFYPFFLALNGRPKKMTQFSWVGNATCIVISSS